MGKSLPPRAQADFDVTSIFVDLLVTPDLALTASLDPLSKPDVPVMRKPVDPLHPTLIQLRLLFTGKSLPPCTQPDFDTTGICVDLPMTPDLALTAESLDSLTKPDLPFMGKSVDPCHHTDLI